MADTSVVSERLDGCARAARHALVMDRPAPDFFEGALLGNGAMGVVVCTRPDAVVLYLGHNDVWDIRVSESHANELLTFAQLMQRLRETWEKGGTIQGDGWFREYCVTARRGYAKPYPRPFPCGSVVLGFDPRQAELLGHRLRLHDGVCEVHFDVAGVRRTLEIFVESVRDRLWLSMADGGEGLFNRVTVLPDDGGRPKDGWMGHAVAQEVGLPEPERTAKGYRQRLPAREDGQSDARDRAVSLHAAVDPVALGCVDLWHGLDSQPTPTLDAGDPDTARRAAVDDWRAFWQRSAVELDDPELESIWYRNLYFLKCVLRPGVTCPGIFGNWSYREIGTAWHGDYHLDYNTQQLFWACFSSNHPALHEPYVDMVHGQLGVARHWAKWHYAMRGACLPLSAYPVPTTILPYPLPTWGWMMSVTPWVVQSLWWHYLYTMDKAYLRDRAWEPMRDATAFLVDYLARDETHGPAWGDDRYHVVPTVSPELHGLTDRFELNRDCIVDLTLIRFLFRAYLEACDLLDRHDDLSQQVRHVLDKLPDYPTADTPDGPVYVSVPGENPETVYNTPNPAMTVFPGEHHGLHSPPDEYALAVRTWKRMRTEGGNDLVFTALQGARLGVLDLEKFKREVRYCLLPNGACTDRLKLVGGRYRDTTDFDFMRRMGVWCENFALPAVINECLLQSYNGVIRLFPNWPGDRDARFETVRAAGAFLVSAAQVGGRVEWIEVLSEAGQRLRVLLPWPEGGVCVRGGETITLPPGEFDTATESGERLRFTPLQ